MIRYQKFITVSALFVHRWYLLRTVAIVLVTTYVAVVMVAVRMSMVRSWWLMSIRK